MVLNEKWMHVKDTHNVVDIITEVTFWTNVVQNASLHFGQM